MADRWLGPSWRVSSRFCWSSARPWRSSKANEHRPPGNPLHPVGRFVDGVDSLTWSRVDLGTHGPGVAMTEGGPGLVVIGAYHEPDPHDLADGGGGPGWVQGHRDLTSVWTSRDGYAWSQVLPDDDTAGLLDFDGEPAGIAGGGEQLAEGKTKEEALRALKRRVSDTVYRRPIADQQRANS